MADQELETTHDHSHDHSHSHDHGHTHDHDAEATAETPKERPPQTVTVTDVGPARKSLTIELPPERIAKAIEDSFGKLSTEAQIPGFRRGRAPRRLIERRFGQAMRDDVKSQLLAESYHQAIEDQKLDVLGEPDVKDGDKITLPDSGSLTYTVEVEVTPEVTLPAFSDLQIKKPKVEVTADKAQEEIDKLQTRFGKLSAQAEGAGLEPGDYLSADVKILAGENAGDDATVISHLPETYVLINGEAAQFKGHVAGIVVGDLGKRLAGKKIGHVERVSMTGPTGHEDEAIKDKPITIVIEARKIERVEKAPLEELPAHLGVENVEALRTRLDEMLKAQAERTQVNAMNEQITAQLMEKVTLDLPVNLSRRQTYRLLQRQAMEMAYQGVPEQEIQQRVAELRDNSEKEAARQLKLFFILNKAAQDLEIEVAENEVNATIYSIAMQQGRRPEKLRQEMQRNGQIEQVYLQVRDTKTLAKIREQAKVEEVDKLPEAAPKA